MFSLPRNDLDIFALLMSHLIGMLNQLTRKWNLLETEETQGNVREFLQNNDLISKIFAISSYI